MWGTKATDWTVKEYATGSMKWHLIDEASLEEKEIEVGWGPHKKLAKRTFGVLDCGRKGREYFTYKIPLILKEEIKLSQSNVCVYCKKARLKEEGLLDIVI